jgi:hypothetical protein
VLSAPPFEEAMSLSKLIKANCITPVAYSGERQEACAWRVLGD